VTLDFGPPIIASIPTFVLKAPLGRLRLFDVVLLMISLVFHTQPSTAKSHLHSGPNSRVHFTRVYRTGSEQTQQGLF